MLTGVPRTGVHAGSQWQACIARCLLQNYELKIISLCSWLKNTLSIFSEVFNGPPEHLITWCTCDYLQMTSRPHKIQRYRMCIWNYFHYSMCLYSYSFVLITKFTIKDWIGSNFHHQNLLLFLVPCSSAWLKALFSDISCAWSAKLAAWTHACLHWCTCPSQTLMFSHFRAPLVY